MNILTLLQDPNYTNKHVLEKLIGKVCGRSREEIIIRYDANLSPEQKKTIIDYYHGYTKDKKPLEYLIGHVSFFGHQFMVNENTLIPRPETEYMIKAVNDYTRKNLIQGEQNLLLDIGTGCGVLGISTLIHNPGFFSDAILTDLINEAIDVAKENYAVHFPISLITTHFYQTNLLDFLFEKGLFNQEISTLTLVTNLPYIPEKTFDTEVEENVKKREPRMAFIGGEDGCDLYRKLFDQILALDKKSFFTGKKFTMFLEMMGRQAEILSGEYQNTFQLEDIETFHCNIKILKGKRIRE